MKKIVSLWTLVCLLTVQMPFMASPSYAQDLILPQPGTMVHLSHPLNPPILKGIKVHPDNPFRFEFILDQGDVGATGRSTLRDESIRLIKYFLASITTPEADLWVNLSPYEKDRIVPTSFGQTEMGRDLLAQDYLLKQITASLIYPEDELGKKFWKRIYEEAQAKYGTTSIPVSTFNKIWIVPDKAVVYENSAKNSAGIDGAGHTAYVVESRLRVMLEGDYLALEKNTVGAGPRPARSLSPGAGLEPARTDVNQLGSQIVREIVIPALTREVNEGANFAQLRQVYNSLILATWYKKKIKESILAKVYADQNKIVGIGINDVGAGPRPALNRSGPGSWEGLGPSPTVLDVETIYAQYLTAFKKGVYNYIKEESDPITQQPIPKKYFSGGFNMVTRPVITSDISLIPTQSNKAQIVSVLLDSAMANQGGDRAMFREIVQKYFEQKGESTFKEQIESELQRLSKRSYGLINPIRFLNDPVFKRYMTKLLINRYIYWGIDNPEKVVTETLKVLEANDADPDQALKDIKAVSPFDSPPWKAMHQKYLQEQYKITYELMIQPYLQNVPAGGVIADIGAGRMGMAKYIALHNPDKVVRGSDVIRYEGAVTLPSNVKFDWQTDSSRLPFEDQSVDVLILNKVLHHVNVLDFDLFVKELHRVLKPSGQIILNEGSYSKEIPFDREHAEINMMDEFMRLVKSEGGDAFAIKYFIFLDWYSNIMANQDVGMPMWYNFQSMDKWEKIFGQRGFKILDKKHFGLLTNTLHRANNGLLVFVNDSNSTSEHPERLIPSVDDEVKGLLAAHLAEHSNPPLTAKVDPMVKLEDGARGFNSDAAMKVAQRINNGVELWGDAQGPSGIDAAMIHSPRLVPLCSTIHVRSSARLVSYSNDAKAPFSKDIRIYFQMFSAEDKPLEYRQEITSLSLMSQALNFNGKNKIEISLEAPELTPALRQAALDYVVNVFQRYQERSAPEGSFKPSLLMIRQMMKMNAAYIKTLWNDLRNDLETIGSTEKTRKAAIDCEKIWEGFHESKGLSYIPLIVLDEAMTADASGAMTSSQFDQAMISELKSYSGEPRDEAYFNQWTFNDVTYVFEREGHAALDVSSSRGDTNFVHYLDEGFYFRKPFQVIAESIDQFEQGFKDGFEARVTPASLRVHKGGDGSNDFLVTEAVKPVPGSTKLSDIPVITEEYITAVVDLFKRMVEQKVTVADPVPFNIVVGELRGELRGEFGAYFVDGDHVQKKESFSSAEIAKYIASTLAPRKFYWKNSNVLKAVEKYLASVIESDAAMPVPLAIDVENLGGIDLTSNNFLQTKNSGEGIKFHLSATQLQALQNSPGFIPVIINIQPMTNLHQFLGLTSPLVPAQSSSD